MGNIEQEQRQGIKVQAREGYRGTNCHSCDRKELLNVGFAVFLWVVLKEGTRHGAAQVLVLVASLSLVRQFGAFLAQAVLAAHGTTIHSSGCTGAQQLGTV